MGYVWSVELQSANPQLSRKKRWISTVDNGILKKNELIRGNGKNYIKKARDHFREIAKLESTQIFVN